MNLTKELYESHHSLHRESGFSILKSERGQLFSSLIGTGKSVLDIGCRDGALTEFFVKGNKVVGIDVDSNALDRARQQLGIEAHNVDAYGDWNELENKKFDAIVAGEILEHLFYPENILKKVSDHLNDGGIFVGSVPNAFSLKNRFRYLLGNKRHTPLSDPTHVNQFSAKELESLLKKYFREVKVLGLGRYTRLSKISPSLFAFDLAFLARK